MLVLASGSAVRRRLLTQAGLTFDVVPADIDESVVQHHDPAERALALAKLKAEHVWAKRPHDIVIGADQVGRLGARWLEKCHDGAAAKEQLRAMRGQTHRFFSAAAVVQQGHVTGAGAGVVEECAVTFRDFSEDELDRYLATNEWRGCCGSYQIEHRGAQLVDDVQGPLTAVWGLPLYPLLKTLRTLGAA